MQIVTMQSHEKSRAHTEQALPGGISMRSPTQTTHASRPPVSTTGAEYESGRQNSDAELTKTLKSLKAQVKGLKDENKALKSELNTKSTTIDKLEKTVLKIQNDESH